MRPFKFRNERDTSFMTSIRFSSCFSRCAGKNHTQETQHLSKKMTQTINSIGVAPEIIYIFERKKLIRSEHLNMNTFIYI